MGDRWDRWLWLGGTLWVSLSLHGVLLVVAGTLDVPQEIRLVIELVEPEPEEAVGLDELGPPSAASSSGEVEAPDAPGEAPAEDPGPTGPPSGSDDEADLPWRERLRRDEARFEDRRRDTRRRLAALASRAGESGASDGAVHRCGATERGPAVDLPVGQSLGRLAPILPDAVLPEAYLRQLVEAGRERVEGGMSLRLVLPEKVLPVRLEDPDVLVVIGRFDARCLVQLVVGGDLFPIRFERLPVRLVGPTGEVAAAVVDVELTVDAEVVVRRIHEGEVGFARGRLMNAEMLGARMRSHRGLFRALRALGGD